MTDVKGLIDELRAASGAAEFGFSAIGARKALRRAATALEQMQRERDEALLPTNARGTAYIVAKGHTMPALQIGTETLKVSGYGFPGEVRAAFTNKAGELRYVIEATGDGYAGMLHIFSPPQLVAAKPAPVHPFDPKYDNIVD